MNQRELIAKRLDQLDLSWYALAKETGIHQGTLSKFKRGDFTLKAPRIVEPLAEALMISPDDIYLAGHHLPPDVHNGIQRHPELINVIRNLTAKLDTQKATQS